MANKKVKEVDRLLTDLMMKVAQERTEFAVNPDGEDIMVTKAEAMVRLLWKMALGYKERDPDTSQEVYHSPDRAAINAVWDRMEGKVMPVKGVGRKKASTADRVHEETKRAVNGLVGDELDD